MTKGTYLVVKERNKSAPKKCKLQAAVYYIRVNHLINLKKQKQKKTVYINEEATL